MQLLGRTPAELCQARTSGERPNWRIAFVPLRFQVFLSWRKPKADSWAELAVAGCGYESGKKKRAKLLSQQSTHG